MTQAILHTELKSRLAEGFIGIGNLAIGSLVFNQFFKPDGLSLTATIIGSALGFLFYCSAIIVFKESKHD